MFISVIISSVSRDRSLKDTLDSLLQADNMRAGDWELILVTDSGTAKETLELGRDYARRFPVHFRFLVQQGRGKSNAMNLAIREARGDVLAMTDDDVICAPEYLDGIREVFSQPGIDGAQGRIFLRCEGGLPAWMGEDLSRFMSLRDYGDRQFEWHDNLAGTSMVVRAAVLERVGGYAPELGAGSPLGFCEDSELSVRIRGAGFRLVYAPQIVVYHQLPRARLTKSFFRRRYFGFGRSQAFYAALPAPLWRFAGYTLKELLRTYSRAAWSALRGRTRQAIALETEARTLAGFFYQHWQFKRGASRHLSVVQVRPSAAAQPARIDVAPSPK
jgi:GT2 family glycosyltransferase